MNKRNAKTNLHFWWPLAAIQGKEEMTNLVTSPTTTMSSPVFTSTTEEGFGLNLTSSIKVSTFPSTTTISSLTYEESVIWREIFIQQDSGSVYWDSMLDMNFTNLTQFYFGNETNMNSNFTMDIDSDKTIKMITRIIISLVLGLVILSTVIGNVFVIAAILLERHLQNVANYLILSLAVADLLVACLVMPLSAVYEVSEQWTLGPELCDMWTSSDVLCCTASILHLVAIALDRYWAVTNIDYIHQRTAGRIGLMILVVWSLAFVVCIAPMFGWKDAEWDYRVREELTCMVSQDLGYQIFATASSFYVPLFVILVLYWRIFQTARKRIRRRQVTSGGAGGAGAPKNPAAGGVIAAASGSGGIAAAVVTIIGRPLPTISETTTAFTTVSSTNTSPEKTSFANGLEPDPPTADLVSYQPVHHHYPVKRKTKDAMDSKRERKAAKTLAIITGAFVFCWLPFFIMAILLPLFQTWSFNQHLMSIFLWLGYFNSTLNPIIYTIFSPEFRQAFKRILCGKRAAIRRRNRHLGIRHIQ